MKHIYTLLLGLWAWSMTMAQEGVNFRDITFEEALKQAKSENKLVFMDCYTSWCGPCKNMADKVFPQKAAGDYFNPRFVCVKYDMEKGAGVELAKKFEVHAYPTFLMIRLSRRRRSGSLYCPCRTRFRRTKQSFRPAQPLRKGWVV